MGIIAILAVLTGGGASFLTSISPAAAQDGEFESFTPELAEQLAEIYQQKLALTPVQQKIDCHILQVVQRIEKRISAGKTPSFQSLSTPLLKMDNSGNIDVKLSVSSQTVGQLEQLQDLGMDIRITLPEYGIVEGSLPYTRVETVAALDFVTSVGTPGYALPDTGAVTSEGDNVLRAAEARAAFCVDGSGIKVGAISDGVTHLSASVASSDLPSSPAVDVQQPGSGDEGTAMLEIVHDLAPGAELAFYGPSSSSDMVAGIGALETAGCDIIVDDLIYFNEPKFEDGPIAQEARQFVNDGGVYVCSAGNSAQSHYIHQYVRTTGPGSGYDYAHDYGGGDIGNTFTVPNGGTVTTILQWNNRWGLAADDFCLILARSSDGLILKACDNYQTGTGDPWEAIEWTNTTGGSVTVFIAVHEWDLTSPPSSLILDYTVYNNFNPNPSLQYSMSGNSVIGHSAVEEVLSTAAAAAATPGTIESFSSRGPGTVYFPTHEDRLVPNITGVDGVQTETGQLGYFSNPFYGTSASAPHVAAIAALVWEADPTLSSSEVFDAITSSAVDLGSAGYDYTWGFGRVDAYEALPPLDYGDAPDPYPTLVASNGARHHIVPGFHLGASVDMECNGQPNANATGDDSDVGGDDEDGVVFTSAYDAGQTMTLTVTASLAGYLDAWVDFNDDGDWADTGEQVFSSQSLVEGANDLSFTVLGGASEEDYTFARFRFSSTGGLSCTGQADDGEVEDYRIFARLIEGDANLDGRTSISDAMCVAQYTVGLRELCASARLCGDTTDDGRTSISDAMHIAQFTVDPHQIAGVLFKPLWEQGPDDDMIDPLNP